MLFGEDQILILPVLRETYKYSYKPYLTKINQWEAKEELTRISVPQCYPTKSLGEKKVRLAEHSG